MQDICNCTVGYWQTNDASPTDISAVHTILQHSLVMADQLGQQDVMNHDGIWSGQILQSQADHLIMSWWFQEDHSSYETFSHMLQLPWHSWRALWWCRIEGSADWKWHSCCWTHRRCNEWSQQSNEGQQGHVWSTSMTEVVKLWNLAGRVFW